MNKNQYISEIFLSKWWMVSSVNYFLTFRRIPAENLMSPTLSLSNCHSHKTPFFCCKRGVSPTRWKRMIRLSSDKRRSRKTSANSAPSHIRLPVLSDRFTSLGTIALGAPYTNTQSLRWRCSVLVTIWGSGNRLAHNRQLVNGILFSFSLWLFIFVVLQRWESIVWTKFHTWLGHSLYTYRIKTTFKKLVLVLSLCAVI